MRRKMTSTNTQTLTTFTYTSSMVPIFEGEAYELWSIQMKTLYISQDLWDLVENGYEQPHDAAELDYWDKKRKNEYNENRKKDAKALLYIQQGVMRPIFSRIIDATTAKEAWEILKNAYQRSNKEESTMRAIHTSSGSVLCQVLKTALELDLFKLIERAGGRLSAYDIASRLPTKNPEAPILLDRMFRFLASQSYLVCDLVVHSDGHVERLYSLAPISKAYVCDQDGDSLSPLLDLLLDRSIMELWYHVKDTILEGGNTFERANGMQLFEYFVRDDRLNEVFNEALHSFSSIYMKRVVENYKGFEGINEIIDVGGAFGTSIALILSKYPNMKAINFDLPHVIDNAPVYPGVEHVAGDMFQSVPKGEAIFMKFILHDWSDELCIKLLKNCKEALPESGKVIIVDAMVPEYPENDVSSRIGFMFDLYIMLTTPSGKERTRKEFESLAKEAGFATFKPMCSVYHTWVMELYKN